LSFILFCLLAPVIVIYYLVIKLKEFVGNTNCCNENDDCCGRKQETANPRQDEILKYLQKNKKVTVGQLLKLFPNITDRTLRRDLNKMEKQGMVVRSGSTKSVHYTLK